MLFSSLEFLYLFLPWTVLVYFAVPKKAKNAVLLFASLLFYAVGEPKYLFLMLAVTAINFIFGRLADKSRHSARFRRTALICAVIFNISTIFFFKYFDFTASALGLCEPLGLALPIGISFYIFQALSYVADVYRGDVLPSGSIIDFSAYVSFFPQLIAGPIVRYSDINSALRHRTHSFEGAAEGIRRFCAGLAKKVLLANRAGAVWERLSALPEGEISTASVWLGAFFYAFQIYFDFSGYSDMAIGLGKIFGFEFPENFNYPYISRSVTEFWRRWHITLSSFFRDYVYIPLGGNRHGRVRTYLNLFAVWSLTGIWHGASYNFLFWGIYYFILLVLEKAFLERILSRLPIALCRTYTLTAVLVGWVIFAADTLKDGFFAYTKNMFFLGGAPLLSESVLYELSKNALLLVIMLFASTPIPKKIFFRLTGGKNASKLAQNVLSLLSLLLCTAALVSSGYNPFLYFRF